MKTFLDTLPMSERFVGAVLRDVEETRKDDRALILEVWERQGLHLTREQRNIFMKCMPAETIRRTRQLIQEHGYYRHIPTWNQRQLMGEQVRNEITKL